MKPRTLRILAAGLALSTGLAYLGWSRWAQPMGEQALQFTPATQQCGSEGRLRYCVNRDPGGVNGDVVYHLHGRNLDETIWNDATYMTAMIQGAWQRMGLRPPTVVTLSYGPVWLLTPKGQTEASGLLDDITPQIDAIEARIGLPLRRIVLGESMGGLNALILGLSQPARFAKVAALCPGVYVDSPFASIGQLKAGAERTGADPKIIFGIVQLARHYLADEQEWRRVSPLALIERMQKSERAPELYLSNGLYDRYGNFEGSLRLADRAQALGVITEWHPIYGGHCASDIASLARFLVQ
ncbi:alpha/beta hydrolase-fold protein [Paucibacter sp. XJ19-41]|uniref:alpha/beta hydrolase-fold protein n=1 Tax=Paucibacter sp. XJ19-41 TaxID=2927824 RepID=UPI00234BE964|nr:alpha/beta hydrolase-fold protein [Paucibacter sp. XJ19-41]MDC6168038.1 alpha/beta hydrolase-fold protein [Paucibacter sp. XJ19-41]